MKREEILKRLMFQVPEKKKKRVIISTDIANEADDPFAIMHHLLTPSEDVRAIISAHFDGFCKMAEDRLKAGDAKPEEMEFLNMLYSDRGKTEERSYAVGEKLMELCGIEDVPLIHGSRYEINDKNDLPESPGADFIIEEAMRDVDSHLYIAMLGAATDVAIALLKRPEIAERMTCIWIGGGQYPQGGHEFNMMQDYKASCVVLESPMPLWQVPINMYTTMDVSQAELAYSLRNCGELGGWLCNLVQEVNFRFGDQGVDSGFPHGETWSLGDNPSVTTLLMGRGRDNYYERKAPKIDKDYNYIDDPDGKMIRVYENVDPRLTMSDLFSKMQLCYGDK